MSFSKINLILLLLVPGLLSAEVLSVQVKQTYLRSKPSFLGNSITKLVYAQQVEDKKVQNGWHFVTSLKSGVSGWVHQSALSEKTIVLNSSQKLSNSSVSQSEILMAGKGFNKQVEAEYKKQNSKLNFTLVDKVEKSNNISTAKLIRFAKNGKLSI